MVDNTTTWQKLQRVLEPLTGREQADKLASALLPEVIRIIKLKEKQNG